MSYVQLDAMKEYLGVYFPEKDAEISEMIDAAEKHVENFLGHSLREHEKPSQDSSANIDPELEPLIRLSIKMHVKGWFEARGVNQEAPLNENRQALQMLHFERTGLGV